MFNAEAELDKEQCRREGAVVEAARQFAATRRACLTELGFDALFEKHMAARDELLAAVAALEELIGPLQEQTP